MSAPNLSLLDSLSVSAPKGKRARLAFALADLSGLPLAACQTIAARVVSPGSALQRVHGLADSRARALTTGRPRFFSYGSLETAQVQAIAPLLSPLPLPFRFADLVPLPASGSADWGYRDDGEPEGEVPLLRYRFSSRSALLVALRRARERYRGRGWRGVQERLRQIGLVNSGHDLHLVSVRISFADEDEPLDALASANGSARVHLMHELLGISVDEALRAATDKREAGTLLGRLRAEAYEAKDAGEAAWRIRLLTSLCDLVVGHDRSRLGPGFASCLTLTEMDLHEHWQTSSRPEYLDAPL